MKSKKTLIFATMLILLLSTVLLAACFDNGDNDGTPDLYYWLNDNGQSYSVGVSSSTTLTEKNIIIPSTYKGKPVTEVTNSAFADRDIESVTIPDSVTIISESAFRGCASLKTINIGKNVKTLGYYAFKDCTSLESIDIPNITAIDANTFENCTSLKTINWSANLTSIGNGAFKNCQALKTLEIPASIVEINDSAFEGCAALENVLVNGNVNVGSYAFRDCTALNSVEFVGKDTLVLGSSVFYNSSVKSITMLAKSVDLDTRTFYDCSPDKVAATAKTISDKEFQLTTIKELVLTEGEEITYDVFNKNKRFFDLTSLTLPADLKSISLNGSGFSFIMENLEKVYFAGTLADWCGIEFNSHPLYNTDATLYIDNKPIQDELIITSDVKKINDKAFYNYNKINKLTIEEGVTSIGDRAFAYNYELIQVTLPSSLTTFGSYVFDSDSKIIQIINYSDLSDETLRDSIYYYVSEDFNIVNDESDAYAIEKIDGLVFIKTNSSTPYIMMGYAGESTSITIPSTVNGEDFYIHPYALQYTKGLKEIIFADVEGWVCQDRNYPAEHPDLTNPENNVELLTKTYSYYTWYRD